jgi:hypothetical protein
MPFDPARHAPTPGRPLYVGDEPVMVEIGALDGEELLLLHHDNVPGKRWELVDPSSHLELAPEIESNLPLRVTQGSLVSSQLVVRNPHDVDLHHVWFRGTLTGAVLEVAAATQGTCDGLSCELGTIAANGSASISVQFTANSPTVSLTSSAGAEAACDAALDVSIQAGTRAPNAPPDLAVDGGCTCRATKGEADWRGLALCCALALASRRLRRGSSPDGSST